jgi:hypothetical protein
MRVWDDSVIRLRVQHEKMDNMYSDDEAQEVAMDRLDKR